MGRRGDLQGHDEILNAGFLSSVFLASTLLSPLSQTLLSRNHKKSNGTHRNFVSPKAKDSVASPIITMMPDW